MEENKGKFTVIFVSYKKETLTMIESNPGLRARITKCIEFENYEPEELFDIAKLMLFNSKYEMDDELICDLAISIFKNSKNKNYGNAQDGIFVSNMKSTKSLCTQTMFSACIIRNGSKQGILNSGVVFFPNILRISQYALKMLWRQSPHLSRTS